MKNVEYLVYVLLAANVLFSWMGFNDRSIFEKYKLNVGRILNYKEYIRIVSSGFLHGDMMHLIFNMIALYSFGLAVSRYLNIYEFSLLYFGSLIIGSLLSIYMHRHQSNYSAIGASGAVSGVVFASILFFPHGNVLLYFFLPIPSWVFGIAYLLYSVYGMKAQNDNIGHEAHLGGALTGVLLALMFEPSLALKNWWLTVILLLIPVLLFVFKPKSVSSGFNFKILNDDVKRTKRSVDDLYYNEQFEKEKELDRLLEKVGKDGVNSLSMNERKRLEELSK